MTKFKMPFKKLFIGTAIFFTIALLFAVFQIIGGGGTVSSKNIDIQILGNAFANGGEAIPLQIQITNRNPEALELADLILTYPNGADETVRDRTSLDTIKAGETVNLTKEITLFGEQGKIIKIGATIEYRIKGSNAIFFKDYAHEVTLHSSPISLAVTAPENTAPNQRYTFVVKIKSNGESVNPNLGLKVDYPMGFRFEESSIPPVSGDSLWSLGDLGPGVEKEVSVTGLLIAARGEERSFRIYVGPLSPERNPTLLASHNSAVQTVTITEPFIDAKFFVDDVDSETYAKRSLDRINGSVTWSNNLPTKIDDLEIIVSIFGNVLDKTRVDASAGFYDSNTNVIRFDKTTNNDFASVQPGEHGTVRFNFASLPIYNGQNITIDPHINISVSVRGKKPSDGGEFESVENTVEKTINIVSDLQLAQSSFYYSGPFTNTGPIPPKASQKTTFTINWKVSNSSNQVTGAKVVTKLPTYVNFTGNTNPNSETVTYNESTREVTWTLGSVPRGTGLESPAREASFQVSITPSISQIGSSPLLTDENVLSGRDLFADVIIENKKPALSIRLFNDAGYNIQNDRVVAN